MDEFVRIDVLCQFDGQSQRWRATLVSTGSPEWEQSTGPSDKLDILEELNLRGIEWTPIGEIGQFIAQHFPHDSAAMTILSAPSPPVSCRQALQMADASAQQSAQSPGDR
ncbi:MAG: hypothetical protein HIU88_10385 [Acidobacteria bacterium]|nr:hypothetical protein [Acidobacteriota bacterium]